MRTRAKVYIGSVLSVGIGMLLASIIGDPRIPHPARFIHCLVLAVLASTFKIRLPGMQSSISLNFVLIIIGIGALSLGETLAIAVFATVVQSLWRPRTRPKTVQVLFNVAAISISTCTADLVTAQLRNGQGYVPGLVMAGMIFFVVNTWLVSLVLAFLSGDSPLKTWRTCHRWSFPYYAAGAALAVIVSTYAQVGGWATALAMLPFVYLLYSYYDTYVSNESAVNHAAG
jgi:hypothetical protein